MRSYCYTIAVLLVCFLLSSLSSSSSLVSAQILPPGCNDCILVYMSLTSACGVVTNNLQLLDTHSACSIQNGWSYMSYCNVGSIQGTPTYSFDFWTTAWSTSSVCNGSWSMQYWASGVLGQCSPFFYQLSNGGIGQQWARINCSLPQNATGTATTYILNGQSISSAQAQSIASLLEVSSFSSTSSSGSSFGSSSVGSSGSTTSVDSSGVSSGSSGSTSSIISRLADASSTGASAFTSAVSSSAGVSSTGGVSSSTDVTLAESEIILPRNDVEFAHWSRAGQLSYDAYLASLTDEEYAAVLSREAAARAAIPITAYRPKVPY